MILAAGAGAGTGTGVVQLALLDWRHAALGVVSFVLLLPLILVDSNAILNRDWGDNFPLKRRVIYGLLLAQTLPALLAGYWLLEGVRAGLHPVLLCRVLGSCVLFAAAAFWLKFGNAVLLYDDADGL